MKPIDSHFAKPGVVPVEVLPVFPDFNLWKYPCAQVNLCSDKALEKTKAFYINVHQLCSFVL